jgi:chromosome segregation ATPase
MTLAISKRRLVNDIAGDATSVPSKALKNACNDTPLFSPRDLPEPLHLYPHGAILRIVLSNFLTYSRCVFHAGPWINMVMGPNGSGKSSLVAAIALGLGASPAVLGRSKNIEEFIQYGQGEAVIEIVLCQRDPQFVSDGFVSITRTISRANTGNNWRINGEPALFKQVKELTASMNINLDNLCQFMPQDKVSEFAKLSPSELLLETERAISPNSLYTKHLQLIEWQREHARLTTDQHTDHRLLDSRQQDQSYSEAVLEAFREREEQIQLVDDCKKKISILEYEVIVDELEREKDRLKEIDSELEQFKGRLGPLRDKLNEMDHQINKSCQVTALDTDLASIDDVQRQLDQKQDQQQTIKADIERLRASVEKKRRDLGEAERMIARLQSELDTNSPIVYDPDHLKAEMKESMLAREAVTNDIAELDGRIEQVRREGDSITNQIGELRRQLNKMSDERERRIEAVRRLSPMTIQAMEWLTQNRNLFKSPVYGPLAIDLQVTKHAAVVEALISRNLMTSFIFIDPEDERQFMRQWSLVAEVTLW